MSHKPNMSMNIIFAAILVAGIIGMLSGFISRQIVTPTFLHEDAFPIEVAEAAVGGGSGGPSGPEPILGLLATADTAKGEALTKQCAACHDFSDGGPNRVGPNLHGVVGRPKGSHAGFAYSDDMKAKGGSWTFEDLNHFLWKPKSFVAGTKMNFIGLKKPEDRAAVIAWLNKNGSNLPMPSQADIDKEQAELAPTAPAAADAAAPGAEGADASKKDIAAEAKANTEAAKETVKDASKTPTPADKVESPQDGKIEPAVTPTEAAAKDDE